MRHIKRFLSAVLAALMIVTPPVAYPAFDPVNDDTDLFLANPNITALRPNVLIALDNTANWNTPFVNEKGALVSVINGLQDGNFNVGLMMMAETGVGNDNVDGAYVRFHVRQMIGVAKTNLATMVNALDRIADASNNAGHGQSLFEAYLYFAGLPAVGGVGKTKTDHDGTTDPLINATVFPAPNHALPGPDASFPQRPRAGSNYRTPIADTCAKNYIILISNGKADTGNAEIATMEGRIQALTGSNAIIPVPLGGQRAGNWSDEMAKFMAGTDLDGDANNGNTQNITTYVVEIDAGSQPEDKEWSAVMESTAINGGGKFFQVSSNASGAAIIDALNAIFNEIQAVNSVFAAATLPVSVNVRGTNLNQVYIGVFRPDAKKSPRWLGNLKMYQLALASNNTVFLADAAGLPTENPGTSFVSPTARSFWTTPSTFWNFAVTRDNPNGADGGSDSRDGDLVEKGGAAQQIRIAYPNAQNPQAGEALRNVYTCTDGGAFGTQCTPTGDAGATPGTRLSLMPFADNNTDITTALLQLGTRDVQPLTAFATKSVSNLTDRRTVVLNNANPATSVAVTALNNEGTTVPVSGFGSSSNLKTSTPKVINSITGIRQDIVTVNLAGAGIVKEGSSYRVTTASGLSGVSAGSTAFTINCTAGDTATFNGLTAAQRTVSTVTSTTSYLIPGPSGSPKTCTAGTVTGPGPIQTSFITVNLPSHGFAGGQQLTIAGATAFPNLNGLTSGITVTDADNFTFSPPPGGGVAGTESGTVTAAGNTTTATATSAGHGFPVGSTIPLVIYGASPSGYNGSVSAFIIDANTFRYTVGSALSDNTSATVYAVRNAITTVTVSAAGHTFIDGNSVTISGANIPEYNGTFTISGVVANTSFQYTTATVLPANTGGTVTASAAGGTLATVTANLPGHGFNVGDSIRIDSTTSPGANVHEGNFAILSVTPPDTFTYSTGGALAAPTGSFTARSLTTPLAFATVTGHGYSNGNQIVISGATPAGYNTTVVSPATITVVDANTFTYLVAAGIGPNTGTSVTSSIKTSTATATSVAHGFATNDSVTITGATPNAFNGTHTINVVNANTFTYSIFPALEGDATGTIKAAGTASGIRSSLINWVRGEDNSSDENKDGSTTNIRASVHGDVLHSRPAVINYNRTANSEDDVFVFYGGNDGIFHAIKGGKALDAASTLLPGREAWGFIAQEFFGNFQRMRNNSPVISSSFKKPYFMDGSIGVHTNDVNGDGRLVAADGDRVILYITNRRGGRFVYALDVSDPEDPKFMWKIDTATSGFSEMGQTWSQPVVVATGLSGYPKPVLVFGGGYDPTVEDIDPAKITVFDSAKVTTADGDFTRTMGRAIYVVDALSGALVWSAGKFAGATKAVAEMHYAIPSDISVIQNFSGGAINRAYVGDTGGQLWRMDFKSDTPGDPNVQNLNGTAVSKIGSIADPTVVAGAGVPGLRKFQNAPDVVAETGFDAVLLGSGDREHPFDTSVTNRFYMFKDKGNDLGPVTGATELTITEAAIAGPPAFAGMSDLTSNCIQDALGCVGGETQSSVSDKLGTDRGWFITLLSGEKAVGSAVSLGGTTFFNTNQPSSATVGVCNANLGIARQYQVSTADATAVSDLNAGGGLTGADRFLPPTFGGFLPSPVHVVVMLEGKPVEAVISGIQVSTPAGATLASRLRKYWYKEVDL